MFDALSFSLVLGIGTWALGITGMAKALLGSARRRDLYSSA
jgi:hypothetical protein